MDIYRDPTLSVVDRVADLLGRMTTEEKVAQLVGRWSTSLVDNVSVATPEIEMDTISHGLGHVTKVGGSSGLDPEASAALTNAIQRALVEGTRLGIPAIVHDEATGGLQHRGATSLPQPLGIASTWNVELAGEIGELVRTEARAVGVTQLLAPVLDVVRDPRWGRFEETFGEAPELVGQLGAAFIIAAQTADLHGGVACTGKHFLGYSLSAGGRNQAPVDAGPRELRDVHARPFAVAISAAGLRSVMNSYSSIDGVPVAADWSILTGLLREELGFSGVVVADYWAVQQLFDQHCTVGSQEEAAIVALSAGLDLELPQPDCYLDLVEAVATEKLAEPVLDTACARVLALKVELGLFESPYVDIAGASAKLDCDDHRRVARRAAAESTVVLTNDGTLPLSRSLTSIAVIGPHADDPRLLQGTYSYPTGSEAVLQAYAEGGEIATDGSTSLPQSGKLLVPELLYTDHVTPAAGLRAAFPNASVTVHRGCPHDGAADDAEMAGAVVAAAASEVAVVFVGARSGMTTDCTNGESRDATNLDLPGDQRALIKAVAETGTPTVVVVVSGRVHTLIDERDLASALVWCAPPGEEAGTGIADVLTGAVDASGRLPVSFPRSVGQIPVHHDIRRRGDVSHWFIDYMDESRHPLFAFGHGLSYTTFDYGGPGAEVGTTTTATVVQVTVTNSGDRAGVETIQLYVTDHLASVVRPVRELIGFARVSLDAGESRRVRFTVDPTRLAFHGSEVGSMVTEPGDFTFAVGSSSHPRDLREVRVTIPGPPISTRLSAIVPVTVSS